MKWVLGISRDITEHKKVEEALKRSEEKYHSLFEAESDAIIILDEETSNILDANEAALQLYGYSYEEITALKAIDLSAEPEKTRFTIQVPGKSFVPIRYHRKKDGTVFVVEIASNDFELNGMRTNVSAIRDITGRKQAEEKILASLREKDILISEIHHRVKNNLQVMSGLLKLQERTSKNQEAIEGFRESQDRIRAMAMIHEKLYSSEDFTKIDLAGYMRSLSQNLFISHNIHPGKIDLTIEISEDIILDVSKAIPCALVMNELISNALKHAFPGDRPGKLQIMIRETESKEIEVIVRDNGVGIPDDVDIQKTDSVGLYLVNGLVKNQIHGQVEVKRDNGTEFRVTIPL